MKKFYALLVCAALFLVSNVSFAIARETITPEMGETRRSGNFTGAEYSLSGGVFNNQGNLIIENQDTVFFDNEVIGEQIDGGAIFTTYSATTTIHSGVIFSSNSASFRGGALSNQGLLKIGDQVQFLSNKAQHGGAVYAFTSSTVEVGSGVVFSSNSVNDEGGAINNWGNVTIGSNALFSYNNALNGGAIFSAKNEFKIASGAHFISNKATASFGGAIYNDSNSTMTIGPGAVFSSNHAEHGGAINNKGTLTIEDGALFLYNTARYSGAAIFNRIGTINMTAKTNNVEFTGNNVGPNLNISHGLYSESGTINLWTRGADIIFNDVIATYNKPAYKTTLNVNQDNYTPSGKVILNENMTNYKGDLNLYAGTVELGPKGTWFSAKNTFIDYVEINLLNNKADYLHFGNTYINRELILSVEADLQNNIMDTIDADNCEGSGKVKVKSIKVLQDSDQKKFLQFARTYTIGEKIESTNKAYSDLYKYNTKYDKYTGLMHFSKKGVNPLRKESGISNIAINNVQKEIAEQVFSRVSGSVLQKQASLNKLYVSADSSRVFNENKLQRGVWLSPYIVKDTMDLGEDVENSAYGTLAGLDWTIGSDKAVTLYCGYNAGKQEYNDVVMDQSGYILGASGIFVKDKLYVGATANVIINNSESENDFGSSETDNKGYSIGVKGGYDIAVGNNWTIEPNMILMYSGVTGSDYTNAQGHEVKDDGISTILIQPGVKGKLSLKNGWQPYGVMNVSINTGENATKVNGIETKDMKLDPYFECGLGLDKEFANTPWSAYAQLTGKAGSRSGFGANLGVKYAF